MIDVTDGARAVAAHGLSSDLSILERHFGLTRVALLTLKTIDWTGRHLTDEHMPSVAAVVSLSLIHI